MCHCVCKDLFIHILLLIKFQVVEFFFLLFCRIYWIYQMIILADLLIYLAFLLFFFSSPKFTINKITVLFFFIKCTMLSLSIYLNSKFCSVHSRFYCMTYEFRNCLLKHNLNIRMDNKQKKCIAKPVLILFYSNCVLLFFYKLIISFIESFVCISCNSPGWIKCNFIEIE